MTLSRIILFLDRWGTVLLVYLLPWQARWIFQDGVLGGAPSESLTASVAATEVIIVALVVIRFIRMRRNAQTEQGEGNVNVLATFGALITLALFSVLISSAPLATVYATQHLLAGLATLYLVMTAANAHEVRIAFVVSMCVESAIAITQASFQAVYPSAWFGIAAHVPDAAGTSVVEAAGMRWLRAYGTFPHPNILGGALALGILVARKLFNRFSAYAAFVYALLTIGLFLSFSRLAWIALGVGVVTTLVRERRNRRFVYASGFIALVAIVMAVIFAPLVTARVTASGRLESKSVTTRLGAIVDAQALFGAHPLTGVGAGAFSYALIHEVAPDRSGYDAEPVHDVPLLVLAEIGIFGLGLFVLLMFWGVKDALANHELGMALALVVLALGDHWAWTTLGGIFIFWAGWGMILRKS